jgi:Bacterial low temperature requirement A protein (LtrA)
MQLGRTLFWLLSTPRARILARMKRFVFWSGCRCRQSSGLQAALAMWWIYFHKGAEAGSELISKSSESGRLARLAYTYLHLPIVAGIILSAVADELVLTHPADRSDLKTVLSAIGGPLLFLLGTILFRYAIRGWLQLSHGVGIVALGRAQLVRRRAIAIDAVDPDNRGHGRRRGVGDALAAIRHGRIPIPF